MFQVKDARPKREGYRDLQSCLHGADEVSAVIFEEGQLLPPLRPERTSWQKLSAAWACRSSSTPTGVSKSAGGSAFSVTNISSNYA